MLYTQTSRLQSKFYIAGIGIFDLFGFCDLDHDPMTYIYELRNSTRILCRYVACANMNFLRQGFRKLSSDRHTEGHKIIYDGASRVVDKVHG